MAHAFIGTAAWTIPQNAKGLFPDEGSHLERYAKVFNAVEINSSFYRDHKPATYNRWAETVPADFRFSVKLSRIFTHEQRLTIPTGDLGRELRSDLRRCLAALCELREKLGCLLVQLPPSLKFEAQATETFFSCLRESYEGPVAVEPRHPSWSLESAAEILQTHGCTRVFADPEPYEGANDGSLLSGPGHGQETAEPNLYFRLHGSPEIYKSNYDQEQLAGQARLISESTTESATEAFGGGQNIWCIFDNTTFGYATLNAWELQNLLECRTPRCQDLSS